ncbi:MAG: hypothetical protein ABFC24_11230 [Methanoregulaceae archaeon]
MQPPQKNDEKESTIASVAFRTIAHFYDADDPTPENNRELSDRAEKEILREVLSVPKGVHKDLCDRLEISLPASDLTPGRADAIISATRAHFRHRAVELQRDRKLIQRVGLREIRLTVAVCVPSFIGIAICSQLKGDPLVEVIENILVIFCWVTIWAPFQSLVFDRWTQSATAKVCQRIAGMDIGVKPAALDRT